ncbi:MAG: amidohydrolase family protein [Phycisphaerae bacterium]
MPFAPETPQILRAAFVAPVSSRLIRDGYVIIERGRIAAVGPMSEFRGDRANVNDLGDAIITPGLINPHTHLELTCYAGQVEPQPFWPWIQRMMQLRSGPGWVEREAASVLDGAQQSLRFGVTCVGDISRCNIAWQPLKRVPIRKVCYAEILSIAEMPPRTPSELRDAVLSIEEDELLTAGITPHAPYTVPADYIRASAELAVELRRPWTTHWAETPEEVALMNGDDTQYPAGLRGAIERGGIRASNLGTAGYLESLTQTLTGGTLAHCNYLTEIEATRLAARGFVGIYCPRAHRYFQHPPHSFQRLRKAGLPMLIGTDSAASNESLSVLAELQFVMRTVADAPSADELLRIATLDAARALGLGDKIGSIEVGKCADLAAFRVKRDAHDALREMIAANQSANAVWVNGEPVGFD